MNAPQDAGVSPDKALRKLFLTLFLRGRTSRGLRKGGAPVSVATKLGWVLFIYAGVGAMIALPFLGGRVFNLALYLHAMTLVFLGMTVAASAGEVLFNKEEDDILLHRPVSSQSLLRAKVSVLVKVSLWLAGALNLGGFFVGMMTKDGSVLFVLTHAVAVVCEALFCTGSVVLAYELCLRHFGRERLDGVMTTMQVIVAVGAVAIGQIVPRLMVFTGKGVGLNTDAWWISLLPPAWFAGLDDALAGSGASGSWLLAGIAAAVTIGVLWLAFWKLAQHYEAGLQVLGESAPAQAPRRAGRSWLAAIVHAPPLRWWLRDPVTRASFLLTAHYLVRDRDVKLRVYPGLAPMLVLPLVFLLQNTKHHGIAGSFEVALAGAYLGLVPVFALNLLQYSQQWQASDIFRAAPLPGPAPICAGARRAVFCFLTLPVMLAFALLAWGLHGNGTQLLLMLPGVIALPLYGLFPHVGGKGTPLSVPGETAKSASRGLLMVAVMFISMAVSGVAFWAWATGWYRWFLLGELVVVAGIGALMHASIVAAGWPVED